MNWLKPSKLVINFTKAARCAERQYHVSANFKLHKLAHIQTFPPSATLHMFTHRASVSILLLSSACFGFTGPYFSISILNTPSVGTHCPYTAQVQTHMHGHRASITAAGATTQELTRRDGPNITFPSHLLPFSWADAAACAANQASVVALRTTAKNQLTES